MLHITLEGMNHRAQKNKYSVLSHTLNPWDALKRSNVHYFFLEFGRIAY